MTEQPILIATRGSALALAQANMVLAECRRKFPKLSFALKIIKSTGDKLQNVPMSRLDANLPRGLFTKELETALLKSRADMAVHSLKDLPTQLPDGLKLGAVAGKRADVRDVLIYRDVFKPKTKLADFPAGLMIATSSTRRKAGILALRPDFKVVEIRGNVHTRLQKLADQPGIDATLLAAAGLSRLKLQLTASGRLKGAGAPAGLGVTILDTDEMLPCVGQGALGLEIRENDERMDEICRRLNHEETFQCVTAERALLRAMGGGCQTPIGAHARAEGGELVLRAVSFLREKPRRGEGRAPLGEAAKLGERVAGQLL
jgi:hydroxymethylbilane synthase